MKGGAAFSYREAYFGNPLHYVPLEEAIFGPGGYVETEEIGLPPRHPVSGASFVSELGDWDLVTPLGVLYMTSANLPKWTSPEYFTPVGIQ